MWHGWKRDGVFTNNTDGALHIGPLPGRKQVALYIEGQGVLNVLAYFKTEEAAEWALRAIDRITGMKE